MPAPKSSCKATPTRCESLCRSSTLPYLQALPVCSDTFGRVPLNLKLIVYNTDTIPSGSNTSPILLCFQVSALAISKSGRYLASGQITYMGFTADIIIWDLDTRQLVHRCGLHKVRWGAKYTVTMFHVVMEGQL